MKSYEVIRDALEREGVSGVYLSRNLKHGDSYITTLVRRKKDSRASTFAQILDALGYDLVARSREDGFEFEIDS